PLFQFFPKGIFLLKASIYLVWFQVVVSLINVDLIAILKRVFLMKRRLP
ncbi:MAG: hypothetical protein QG627_957, partial [Chlamydiota bacterium]|nr:hypothetical protein [Chlamydiota bacterium]